MRFGLSEEQVLLQDNVNRFLSEQVGLDGARAYADGGSDAGIWQGLAELGVAALLIPEAQGGIGLGSLDAAIVAESLGYHATPAPFLGSAVMAPTALVAAGGQEDLLAELAAGSKRVGIAFGDAVGRRNDAQVNFADGRLNGKVLFAFDADADFYLVADQARNLYLVDSQAAGCERSPLTTVDKTRRTVELAFSNTPATVISEDPEVYTQSLDIGRVMLAADTLGAAQNMLDQAVDYAKQREQFNRPIASFQAVKHMCAEMVASLEPCRSMVWFAGHALTDLPDEARLTACHTKAHLAEVGKFVSKTATEVHGGMGFTDLLGLHYWFKRIGANRQWLGSPEGIRHEAAVLQGLVA
ncbi:MAG TPA: acyl-CoA dehydrogenase [Gammaproteobacteria bacterium]|nr:acyl-CoA dehydrogenase [Gammaproteobacteria bacterium]|tara:strand:- start:6046 stop:7110 length:1065 start_codon:yes stop_codon:yes gene_type:complete